MSQPEPPDDGRYKSRGRKERTPEQLKILAMAREKAKLVIQERTKIKKEMASKKEPQTELPVEDSPLEPELPVVSPPPEPEPPVQVPPPQPSLSRDEIQNLIHSTLDERRPHERKYAFVDGMYVKIK
jgi:hypothetical protein